MEQNELTDHAYDGIQEYDNPLPGWWKWTFVGSIVFSVCYLLYFHIGAPGRSVLESYDTALAANTLLQFGEIGDLEPDEATLTAYTSHESKKNWLRVGSIVYKTNCVSCHGRDGEGKVGPNLTDDYFKNIRKIEDIARVIKQGAGNGAMPAWGERLHPNEVVLVSAYIASLRGTEAAGGKAPEGSQIAPWPEAPLDEPPKESETQSDKG
ncbi:MAG: cbb3-type cytochrome c oxidase N-terminal domain-containing protein [Pirellulaceae bacterium]